ncbi:MAG TPA: SUMF1/EgtB/PvdO family nonheme iron enzyme [Methylomirabilota bacterium]|jgi:formylglycine-generating enzyme required for sulfatase activity|nr:SUMF1/EgtB/PvdO family nonheme iron enzyme [Methylomirabilota bacterium]HEV8672453.1 SUMF1/EgtB/PvdO family nonheme iron enzyme [Methylomirabilota bacterium]
MGFVEIPEGAFWMGWPDGERGGRGEQPRHRVWLDRFAIATHPVTNAEYGEFLAATGAPPPPFRTDPRFSDAAQPVVGVTWGEAVAYCAWLGRVTGRPHRLPTEAEWEHAARGGLDGARYPWGDASPEAVFPGVRLPLAGPPPVGSGPSNGFGLTDLSGCVHEWCLDWHDEGYYAASPERNPPGPAQGIRRASRGGAWRHQIPWSPVAHRSSLPPHLRYSDYGFRVAAGLDGTAGS